MQCVRSGLRGLSWVVVWWTRPNYALGSPMPSKRPSPQRLLRTAEIDAFFSLLAERIVPQAELDWESCFDLLVAVVLSAQCTDRAVNRVTERLRRLCPGPQGYLDLGEEALQAEIRSIGLFRNKTRFILGICRGLLARFGGEVPSCREDLESLPGVGRKTANVVLNVGFGQPTLAVDTHVFRVSNRVGLVRAKNPLETERQLLTKVPQRFMLHAHHYLILHGRYTCKARKPDCRECPVAGLCTWPSKTLV
jgi:endonuclease III